MTRNKERELYALDRLKNSPLSVNDIKKSEKEFLILNSNKNATPESAPNSQSS